IYLASGAAIEALRRIHPSPSMERASLALDSLPARVLEFFGVLGRLRSAYLDGRLSELSLRLIFGGTVVAVIFAMAVGGGGVVGLGRWALSRQTAGAARHH